MSAMVQPGVHFSDVVDVVLNGADLAEIDIDEMEPPEDTEGDNSKTETSKNGEKKPRQNKSYVTAKTLNDREERRLMIKLNHYQKELKQNTYQIDVAQRAIRRELQSINPDLTVDPNKGFFVPKGMTQEQAELIKSKRRELHAAANTRSISLDEFTEMRKKKTEMGRQALQAIQQDSLPEEESGEKPTIKGRDRWKALAGVLHSNPASFSQMSKVAAKQHQQQPQHQQQSSQQQDPPPTAPTENTIRNIAKMASVVNAMRGFTR